MLCRCFGALLSADDTPLPWRDRPATIAILHTCGGTLHMPTKSSKPKWADAQFVLDADGLPLPRGTRANELLSTEQAGRKRGRSTESVLGGPELCGPVEDLSGVAFTASDEARGGPAALRHYREARGQVDWVAVGEKHYGSQSDEHAHEPPEAPRSWWHGPNRDQGLEDISARAAAFEAKQQASSAPQPCPDPRPRPRPRPSPSLSANLSPNRSLTLTRSRRAPQASRPRGGASGPRCAVSSWCCRGRAASRPRSAARPAGPTRSTGWSWSTS